MWTLGELALSERAASVGVIVAGLRRTGADKSRLREGQCSYAIVERAAASAMRRTGQWQVHAAVRPADATGYERFTTGLRCR